MRSLAATVVCMLATSTCLEFVSATALRPRSLQKGHGLHTTFLMKRGLGNEKQDHNWAHGKSSSSSHVAADQDEYIIPDTDSILQDVQPVENAYVRAHRGADKHADKAKSNWTKYGALRYQNGDLAQAAAQHYFRDRDWAKKSQWKALKDNSPQSEYSREAMLPHLEGKKIAYNSAAYEALSASTPGGNAAALYHKYAKYATREEALRAKSSKAAHKMSREYDEKAARKERDGKSSQQSVSSSLRKAGFYNSEANRYREAEDKSEDAERIRYSVRQAMREDASGIDHAMSGLGVEYAEPRRHASGQEISHQDVYRDKARYHDDEHEKQAKMAREYKAQADLHWLMYNAIEYHIPKFAKRVGARLERQGDRKGAAVWRNKAKEMQSQAYQIPSLEQIQSARARLASEHNTRPSRSSAWGNPMMDQHLFDKDHQAWSKIYALQHQDPSSALRVAAEYKRKARDKVDNKIDPTSSKMKAGGWISLADSMERKNKEQAEGNSRKRKNMDMWSLEGVVPGP